MMMARMQDKAAIFAKTIAIDSMTIPENNHIVREAETREKVGNEIPSCLPSDQTLRICGNHAITPRNPAATPIASTQSGIVVANSRHLTMAGHRARPSRRQTNRIDHELFSFRGCPRRQAPRAEDEADTNHHQRLQPNYSECRDEHLAQPSH